MLRKGRPACHRRAQSREPPAEPLGGLWSGPRGPSTTGRGSSWRGSLGRERGKLKEADFRHPRPRTGSDREAEGRCGLTGGLADPRGHQGAAPECGPPRGAHPECGCLAEGTVLGRGQPQAPARGCARQSSAEGDSGVTVQRPPQWPSIIELCWSSLPSCVR